MARGLLILAVLTGINVSAQVQVATGTPQGTTPKEKPGDYPAQGQVGRVTIAVENWGHGFSTPWGAFATDDYIVIEVALFGEVPGPLEFKSGQFRLRLNKKTTLYSQAPGMVAASLKYPDWEIRKGLTLDAGLGNGSIILGRKPPVERFPDDPRPRQEHPSPPVPRTPGPDDPPGVRKQPMPSIDEIVARVALVEGESRLPVSGYLFFPYKGKLKALKSIEVVYDGPAGEASVLVP